MKSLLDGFKALGPARLAALGAVALGMLTLLALLALRSGSTDQMALLYGDLDLRDSAQVVEHLARRHIPYRLAGQGSQVLVPTDQVAEARLSLARDGLPSGGSVGYELFDRGDSLAFTDFQQKINETRALEGELARTIRAMRGVRAVRVHLVLPRREPFARDRQDAQASVLLTMSGAQRLDKEGVQAILNLVAAAVPGLRPQNVAIVDSRGDLLARAGEPVSQLSAALTGEEIRRGTELRLARAVEEMLERSLGPGHVRAEAAVRMNFDKVSETQERYDPDGQVTRSSQTVTANSKNTEAAQAVTVQNNLPNADAGNQNGAGSQENRQEETTNYEISRTVRTLLREQPQLDRISLAVMVDGVETTGPDGKRTWQPRPAEDLDRIANLVRSAIGYDEKRGDHVEVVSMRFAADEPSPDSAGLFGLKLEKPDVLHLAQTALFGVIALLALLLVLRPMVARLTTLSPAHAALAGPNGTLALAGPNDLAAGAPALGGGSAAAGLPALPGAAGQAGMPGGVPNALLEDESMVNISQIEGQMRASSLRKLAELVDKHPQETLTIMRGWMAQEHG
ncbi:MAG: flagellar M-ring protein FliF [Rhodospirillales bacterium 69-11]|nr:flagellar M-ring protein FliF [Rhodospirillales bacterium]OJW28139.1 MAG: flagellar M-ring protein FliF [Rhodospirillales bacterium 69-11]